MYETHLRTRQLACPRLLPAEHLRTKLDATLRGKPGRLFPYVQRGTQLARHTTSERVDHGFDLGGPTRDAPVATADDVDGGDTTKKEAVAARR